MRFKTKGLLLCGLMNRSVFLFLDAAVLSINIEALCGAVVDGNMTATSVLYPYNRPERFSYTKLDRFY